MAILDALVHRKTDGNVTTTVYKKATNTRQILNYQGNHPLCHKPSCVRRLHTRAETHYSKRADKVSELRYLRQMFTTNGYPRSFIDLSRRFNPTRRPEDNQPKSLASPTVHRKRVRSSCSTLATIGYQHRLRTRATIWA